MKDGKDISGKPILLWQYKLILFHFFTHDSFLFGKGISEKMRRSKIAAAAGTLPNIPILTLNEAELQP